MKGADAPLSVLVVDDDPDILRATVRLLRGAGYATHEAATGGEALERARALSPDLLLLDVDLPDLSGFEVCRDVKADPALAGTLVVMTSGKLVGSDHQAEGLELGADGYVTRPVPNREFLARIASFARLVRAERARDRLIAELREALATIRPLSGLLPICCGCKRIRDDRGYWEEVETYVKAHTGAEFTHGICPECERRLYGGALGKAPPPAAADGGTSGE